MVRIDAPTSVTKATSSPIVARSVSPIASAVLGMNGRSSSTSYALFIAFISALVPPVAAHSAAIAPNVSRPGRVVPMTAWICGAMALAMSGGRLSLTAPRIFWVGSSMPTHWATNAVSAATKIPNGKTANRNRYAELGRHPGHVVPLDLCQEPLPDPHRRLAHAPMGPPRWCRARRVTSGVTQRPCQRAGHPPCDPPRRPAAQRSPARRPTRAHTTATWPTSHPRTLRPASGRVGPPNPRRTSWRHA